MAKRARAGVAGTITVAGVEYVVIPKAEYLRLSGVELPAGTVDAADFARELITRALRLAREHAGLTQAELAERMGKSQSMVSQAEAGGVKVSERYMKAVLRACGLPENWTPPKPKRKGRKAA